MNWRVVSCSDLAEAFSVHQPVKAMAKERGIKVFSWLGVLEIGIKGYEPLIESDRAVDFGHFFTVRTHGNF